MPMKTTTIATAGDVYPSPFVGPVQRTVAIDCNIANLTTDEVDANGILKPGVPLTALGALLGAITISSVAAGAAQQNAAATLGNGTIGAATGGYNKPSETITITMTGSGATAAFRVDGSKSGYIGTGAVGTAFASAQINVTISDGSTDWAALNTITFVVTGGTSDKVHGVTYGCQKLVANNGAALTGTFQVVVATDGLINRDLGEDILGRSYTATEIAAMTGSLKLTNT